MHAWSVDHATRLRTQIERLKTEQTPVWTETDLRVYLVHYRRLKGDTVEATLRQLRFMARHADVPVKLDGTREELVNTFFAYVTHREHNEAAFVLNDHKAVRRLGDFLGVPREVWPTAPVEPKHDDRQIPSPEDVYALLHETFSTQPYEDALVRHVLAFDFGFGPRFPSEVHALRVSDFDPERHLVTIIEPKKSGRRRTLAIEPEWLCCSRTRPSLANWLRWRSKVVTPESGDAFFLRPDGRPFASKYNLNSFLWRHMSHLRGRYPWFQPYMGRHWCAMARLIEWDFDYVRVADWLGHEKVDRLRREYDHGARIYQRLYGQGWLLRAFQKQPLKSKPPSKKGVLTSFPPGSAYGSVRI